MHKEKVKPWLVGFLLVSTIVVIAGAWAKSTKQQLADILLGTGLAGTLISIVLYTALFGAKNRPSNWKR